jgi:transcriptional regulator of met regulon|tara:strand:+ start:1101 stop:1244 length:144 start_codon:yes stop_codon:yes gene_type:complete
MRRVNNCDAICEPLLFFFIGALKQFDVDLFMTRKEYSPEYEIRVMAG